MRGKPGRIKWFALRARWTTRDWIGVDPSSVEYGEGEDDDGAGS
jgi:hypothetical protein